MENDGQPLPGTEPASDRLSRLSLASLRINESLDVDTALQAVMDSARSLTDAPYVLVVTLDASGRVVDRLVQGFDPGDEERLWQAPEGERFLEYLKTLPGSLRVGQLAELTASIGLQEFRSPVALNAFMAAPILHRGARSGLLFVGSDEAGREFSREDEETLVLFAAQAGQVIANARQHRDEQRARATLETLIDTSPVGIVVFDMRKGAAVSFNRETRRIIDGLLDPDQVPEDLLGSITMRRADGREVSLREFPVDDLLGSGKTVRAEEIDLRVPDGRKLTVLINVTPIRSADGEVDSVVVTMQDLTAVEEGERLRAEFLAMVSHELRAPLTSIKGSAATVLGAGAELDPALVRQFFRIIEDQADHMHGLVADLLDVARIATGSLAVSPEPAEVAALLDRARNAFSSAGRKNDLAIDLGPDLPLVLADRRRIVQVLVNLLSNAARNSPESSSIRISATRDRVHVAISVADRGRGIPEESLLHIFKGYSRAQSEEQEPDTGLGLAICKGIVGAHGGRIWAESDGPNLGARFTFTLPVAGETADEPAGRSPSPSSRLPRREGQPEKRVRVLAVDDDPEALRYISDTLSRSGYTPIVTGDPEEALGLMEEKKPGLVLLDLMLPGTDGIELMKDLLVIADVPVIFLSAYGQDEHIVKAFDMGAADYVVKPFSPSELAARIRAALRLREVSEPSEPYVLGDLTIEYAGRRVTLAGHPLELMAIEYRTLVELSANAGRVVTQRQLLQRIWGDPSGSGDVRPLRTIVSRLRRKLGDDANNPTYIFTEPRVGYRMPAGETREPEKT